ncbi:MAG TPA: hypothetical protein VGI42_02460 [Chthoniobacterales bacterium]|jgi:hypothetical protein
MRISDRGFRKAGAAAIGLLLFAGSSRAEPSPSTSPSPSATAAINVRISFLPPPLDGTISLGVYDAKGKLVRVLHREADINEFEIGQDALSTTWDGKSDAGENVPAGKYNARGFVVGDLQIEGVGFFFNDWITADDSPRFSRIRSLEMRDDNLLLGVEFISQKTGHLVYDVVRKITKLSDTDPLKIAEPPGPVHGCIDPVMATSGRNETRWVIDRTAKDAATTELKQFSSSGEFLRRLAEAPGVPQPAAVAASASEDKIYLLEENGTSQRLRGLALLPAKSDGASAPISEWKVDFEKWIIAHKDFSIVNGKPVASPGAAAGAPEKLKIKLEPNPLLNDKRTTVELMAGFDADGSFLKTSDGLPLRTVSETQELVRGLLAPHEANAIDVFQDDGAVVEQFRVTGVDEMMSFDCGVFELK